jgi:dihydrolipoamide dehydrogenase
MSDVVFDVVFIGSGPGGYVGAIRAAQLGLKTAMVEKEPTFGGTCLNVGCIPSKALLESSEHFLFTQHEAAKHGIKVQNVELDLPAMMTRKEKIVFELTRGIAGLFKKNKIETFSGMGTIKSAQVVQVRGIDGSTFEIQTKNIVISTGSSPVELPFLKFDEKKIVSSTGALSLPSKPLSMTVVGGGVIGLEMASVWSRLGTKVTVIEFAEKICSMMDQESIQVLIRSMKKEGVEFKTSCKVTSSEISGDHVTLTYEDMKSSQVNKITSDVVLVATGRRPFTRGLGCEDVGVQLDGQGRVQVDSYFRTSVPHIYAVGDVIAGPMLAHKAEEEGVAVAEILAGQAGHVNYGTVPSVIYTHPEVASVGISQEEAVAQGLQVNIGKFPFLANGRAKAKGFTEGFVKIIADAKTDRILGGHIVGPSASELLGEIIVAMEFGGSSEDLARSFHSHPTLSEVIREAALAVEKRARQI